jgi:SPP1 family holin
MNNLDKGTVIRTVLLFIALLNQILIAFGKAPVSLNEQQIGDWYMVISTVVTGVLAGWAWFKNNYITQNGQLQKKALQAKGLIKK